MSLPVCILLGLVAAAALIRWLDEPKPPQRKVKQYTADVLPFVSLNRRQRREVRQVLRDLQNEKGRAS
jgi:hypothetical protein